MQTTDRRFFLKTLIAGGIALQIPFVFSCNSGDLDEVSVKIDDEYYNVNLEILRGILEILFPNSTFAPGAIELKSDIYYVWIIHDERLKQKERKFLASNLIRFEQFCVQKQGESFLKLSSSDKIDFVELVSNTIWGENYLSRVITIIMESMFAHPVYGSNPHKIGWQWLNYRGGIPEPQEWNKYPEILNLNTKA